MTTKVAEKHILVVSAMLWSAGRVSELSIIKAET